ncbi:hypothetical protein DWF00_09625 [Bosea caraganae]|uniref:HdeA/HdeB family protein n=1 Tax=Bosea caraganae TaxID=2763117 RepID=A0A370LCJ9_9HYPH|nr:HdeA/HdeB family chaperone [Bosea caraganae]RDJ27239.1 hypothetical protein DWF00_09625 [Bosea caraganae]RDJ29255.1 hypothetical protein DWE98_01395 [Bosea caraganae]
MKTVSLALFSTLMFASGAAHSQVILDMTLVTCKQYRGMSANHAEVLGAWMGGYFHAANNITMLDLRYVDRNLKKITAYCKSHRNETLMSAVEKVAR